MKGAKFFLILSFTIVVVVVYHLFPATDIDMMAYLLP